MKTIKEENHKQDNHRCMCGCEGHNHENKHEHNHQHGHEECACGCDIDKHNYEKTEKNYSNTNDINKKQFILDGLGCAGCSAKIEHQVGQLPEVASSVLNFATSTLNVELKNNSSFNDIISKINKIVTSLEPDVTVIEKENKRAITNNVQADKGVLSKRKFISFGVGIVIFSIAAIGKFSFNTELAMFIISYLLIGGDVVVLALKNIIKGNALDENFLMVIATIGAFSIKDFTEAVAVMIFYKIGEAFQQKAVNSSRKSIADLMNICPDIANLKIGSTVKKVLPEELNIGDVIIVKPGEKVPIDGAVLEGESMIDTSALTGESVPRKIKKGDEILSGFINKNGVLNVKVTKIFSESAVSRILELVENAGSKKAKIENFITKFARYYTPIVVVCAIVLAIVPSIFIKGAIFSDWLRRALIFLVVSCPCALVISVPIGFFGGIGAASRKGILIKGGNYLEALNELDTIVFDKTGTLTKGVFNVTELNTFNEVKKEELLRYAAFAESYSNHPIANSILKAYSKAIDKSIIEDYEEIAGHGIKALIKGKQVLAGNDKLMGRYQISFQKCNSIGTVVYVAVDNQFYGYILIADEIKEDSVLAIKELKKLGVKETIMLTGDNKIVGNTVASELGIDNVYTELLPENKVEIFEKIENLKKQGNRKNKRIAFVGDGVNDAPVLTRADIGIAMGGLGSDAAIEAADIVLMTDEPSKLITAVGIAKYTRKIVMQNIVFALGVKLVVLSLGAFGLATMMEGVFADVGVALLAVLNSMRVLKYKD
ncbi:heavy metal translocating P-type ATPase [Clostridium aestuarii]|uniref:Cd(2+)-exporting ATPase n=1 Tax=Clostridium aestuarii TaxID=338193 RepID=A0ABT4D047_9CLOT|nr:heavy metal translocating P-type ATPase [Clostridium aestuarii]MCY6484467.1 heavy metal translocating P-type ATPase [Clostridium aestuarii]